MSRPRQFFWLTLSSLAIVESFSLVAYQSSESTLQVFGLATVLLFTFFLSLKRLEYGLLIVLTELFVSSFGHLFQVELGSFKLTLRMGLFFVLQLVFNLRLFQSLIGAKRRTELTSFFHSPYFVPNLTVFLALVLAVFVGMLKGNELRHILREVDAYLIFGYFPLIWAVFREKESRSRLINVFIASLVWLAAQTALVLFIFAHRLPESMRVLYLWIRDARLGEITLVAQDFYRIFFQSYVYVLAAIFIFAVLLIHQRRKSYFWFFTLSVFLLLISFSRSFWFGGLLAALLMIFTLRSARTRTDSNLESRSLVSGLYDLGKGILLALILIFVLVNFPLPFKGPPILLADLFRGRAFSLTDEAAVSRWNLLPVLWSEIKAAPILGAGLGKTITYQTTDPRFLAEDPTGQRTTYAFEWGYLDLWLKLGLFGLAAYGWLIIRLLRRGWQSIKQKSLTDYQESLINYGLWLGLAALLVTHFFSPYLNHPLGIGALVMMAVWFEDVGS